MTPFRRRGRTGSGCLVSAIIAVTILFVHATATGQTPGDRMSDGKTCAELLERLLAGIRKPGTSPDELATFTSRFGPAGFDNPKLHVPGSIAFSKSGAVLIREHGSGAVTESRLFSGISEESGRAARQLLDADEPTTITGTAPLSDLLHWTESLGIRRSSRNVFFNFAGNEDAFIAKRAMLDRRYAGVEVWIDLDAPSDAVEGYFRRIRSSSPVSIPEAHPHVLVRRLKDLPGGGTIAERALRYQPAPDILIIDVSHQSAGVFQYTDGSSNVAQALAEAHLKSRRFQLDIGCNIVPPKEGWVAVNGTLLTHDVADMAKTLEDAFVAAAQREPAARLSGRDVVNGVAETLDRDHRRSFRLLSLVPLALGWSMAEGQADAAGFAQAELLPVDATTPVDANLDPRSECDRKLAEVVASQATDRQVVYVDLKCRRIALLLPSRGSGLVVPAPVVSANLDAPLSTEARAIFRDHAAEISFVLSANTNQAVRTELLAWQGRNHLVLPFLMLDITNESGADASALLRPFFEEVTEVGDAIPMSDAESWSMKIFWCDNHKTQAKIDAYRSAADGMVPTAATLPLGGTTAAAELQRLWRDGRRNAWLWGAWSDSGLLRAGREPLPFAAWVGATACEARVVIVSVYPVSRPRPKRYFEPAASEWLPLEILGLRADIANATAFERRVSDLQRQGRRTPIYVGVSSCGKVAIFSE